MKFKKITITLGILILFGSIALTNLQYNKSLNELSEINSRLTELEQKSFILNNYTTINNPIKERIEIKYNNSEILNITASIQLQIQELKKQISYLSKGLKKVTPKPEFEEFIIEDNFPSITWN